MSPSNNVAEKRRLHTENWGAGQIGFSSVEAALIRKDLRAFTRRREILGIYIMPIIIVIISIFYSSGITTAEAHPQTYSFGPA